MPLAESPDRIPGVSWRDRVPALTGSVVVLRELQHHDALSLDEALSIDQLRSSPPPPFAMGVRGSSDLSSGRTSSVSRESDCASRWCRAGRRRIGSFELHALESAFATAAWRFALSPEFWGIGVFADGARLVIDFLFETIGARRLEARAALHNVRANAALISIGAIREALLRGRTTDRARERRSCALDDPRGGSGDARALRRTFISNIVRGHGCPRLRFRSSAGPDRARTARPTQRGATAASGSPVECRRPRVRRTVGELPASGRSRRCQRHAGVSGASARPSCAQRRRSGVPARQSW